MVLVAVGPLGLAGVLRQFEQRARGARRKGFLEVIPVGWHCLALARRSLRRMLGTECARRKMNRHTQYAGRRKDT
jgi:hypothetical protein